VGVHLSNIGTTVGVGVLGSSYVVVDDDDELAFGQPTPGPIGHLEPATVKGQLVSVCPFMPGLERSTL
jgi:hypothetical protein